MIDDELIALVGATKDRPFGSVVTHAEIEALTKINQRDKVRPKLIRKWKRSLVLHGRWVVPATPYGTGYRLCTKEEMLVVQPNAYRKKAARYHEAAAACLGAIAENELNDTEKLLRQASLGQLAEVKRIAGEQQKQLRDWLAQPARLPKFQFPAN
jgi:hypothetical protein